MPSESAFRRPEGTERLVAALTGMEVPETRLMEVCGTHTMAIARAGLKRLLPPQVTLLSGPGCPVCVTPAGEVDRILRLAREPGVTVVTYGDLMRVPGSRPDRTLARCRAEGADVRWVYSPMDALEIARDCPEREVVFLGVGFETTAPGTALTVLEAERRGLKNFSLLSLLKLTPPALRALLARPGARVDGFLCPGHVATVIGAEAFRFLPEEYGLPAVVAGFEPGDLLAALCALLRQVRDGAPRLENEYLRAVAPEGNPAARALMERVLEPADARWRGLGKIPASGLRLRDAWRNFDAGERFALGPAEEGAEPARCRCGEVICGECGPEDCPLFARACTPETPVGPCMVSGEGACAAAYRYRGLTDGEEAER